MLSIIILALISPSAFAQTQESLSTPTCQNIVNQLAFNGCISNSLKVKGTKGSQVASNQIGSCYTQQSNGTAYSQCLCAKTSSILNCYNSWCAGDAGETLQKSYQMLFCKAFHSGTSTTNIPVIPAPPAPSLVAPDISNNPAAVGFNYGNSTKSASLPLDSNVGISAVMSTVLGIVYLFA